MNVQIPSKAVDGIVSLLSTMLFAKQNLNESFGHFHGLTEITTCFSRDRAIDLILCLIISLRLS